MRSQTSHNADLLRDLGMLSFLACAFLVLFASPAMAGSTVGGILCSIYSEIQTDVGRGIATLAVASLGISALVGKVSWGMAIMVAVGVAVLFGADTILTNLGLSHC